MTAVKTPVQHRLEQHAQPALQAWRNVLGMFVVLGLLLGLLDFAFLAQMLATSFRDDLVFASLLLSVGFAVSSACVVIGIALWQRAHGETLRDLGWQRPTTRTAVLVGVVYGVAWAALTYARGGNPLAVPWERLPMAIIGVFLAFCEELAVRGFVLEHLRRGSVPGWLQVAVSAVGMGSYHGVIGLHYSVFYAASSAVLFGLLTLLFMLGKRSLTPGWVAHSLAHVLGDPTLTEGILQGVLALA